MPQRKLSTYLPYIALGALLLLALAFVRPPSLPPYALAHIERVEAPAAREQGLSGRADIPEDFGMLFVFPQKDTHVFWMKDMLAPIDIIWLLEDGTIAGIEPSVATSTYPNFFEAPVPVRYVLETKAGTARARGWGAGTQLSLPLR